MQSHTSPLALAAALNQLKAAVAASPIVTPNVPVQNAEASIINLTSPQVVTALVNEALKGAKSNQMTTHFQTATLSPCGNKSRLQTTPMSPLLQSVGAVSPAKIRESSSISIPNGSPHLSKSPGPKVVTVSKLPTTPNDHLLSLLQSLQQPTASEVLIPVIATSTNGHTSVQSPSNGVM